MERSPLTALVSIVVAIAALFLTLGVLGHFVKFLIGSVLVPLIGLALLGIGVVVALRWANRR
jgi:hypothetical protein